MDRYFFSPPSVSQRMKLHCLSPFSSASDIQAVERRSLASETTAQTARLFFSALSIIIPRFLTMKEQGISRSNQSMTVQMYLPCDHHDIVSKSVHHSIGALKICTDVSFTPPLARYSPCICYIMRWHQFAFIFWLHLTEFYSVRQFAMDEIWHHQNKRELCHWLQQGCDFILSALISRALKE